MVAVFNENSSAGIAATLTGNFSIGEYVTATLPIGVVGTLQFTRTLTTSPFTKTAISGAVASAVNSLSYQIQPADAAYSIGVDASNQVTTTLGGIVSPAGPAPTYAVSKAFNASSFNSTF